MKLNAVPGGMASPAGPGDTLTTERLIFRNAEYGELTESVLRVPAVLTLIRAVGRLFDEIDVTDPAGISLARQAWRLRATVINTPLPFGSPELSLDSMCTALEAGAEQFPAIREQLRDVRHAVQSLFTLTGNPKHEKLLETILLCGQDRKIGLVTALTPGTVPGWPAHTAREYQNIPDREVILLQSRRDLRAGLYHTIIVPGGMRWCSRTLAADIDYGCRARRICLIRYEGESAALPGRACLPSGQPFSFPAARWHQSVTSEYESAPPDKIEAWATERYWESLRTAGESGTVASDEAEPARFTVFANGAGAFLPAEGAVIEVSDLFREGAEAQGDLRRKPVTDLEDGDVVVIRSSGTDGDDIELLADALLARDGFAGLRQTALDWKPLVARAIRERGSRNVADSLRRSGGHVPSAAYLKNWAGTEVMAPQRFEDFRALLLAVLPVSQMNIADPEKHAALRWGAIEQLKRYHHRAGQHIRKTLLAKISKLAGSGQLVGDDDIRITLPDVEGAEMALLRVAAMDPSTVDVPRSRLFRFQRSVSF